MERDIPLGWNLGLPLPALNKLHSVPATFLNPDIRRSAEKPSPGKRLWSEIFPSGGTSGSRYGNPLRELGA